MSKLEWNINFMLGIQEIDEHHEHLFELLNFGYDKFEAGHNIGLLVVAELVDYC
jgi:hemerythrin